MILDGGGDAGTPIHFVLQEFSREEPSTAWGIRRTGNGRRRLRIRRRSCGIPLNCWGVLVSATIVRIANGGRPRDRGRPAWGAERLGVESFLT